MSSGCGGIQLQKSHEASFIACRKNSRNIVSSQCSANVLFKGRLCTHNVPLDFAHLAERVRQFNNEEIEKEAFMAQLKDRLASANINQVKNDVLPFVRNPKELDIWSNDYFVQLADMMKFE